MMGMAPKFKSKEELEKFLEGKTPSILATELGIPCITIYRNMRRLGVTYRQRPHKYGGIGNTHRNWKGGRHKDSFGYIVVYTGKESYGLEHQMVMEKVLGRKLYPWERVHHKNGDRADNRKENLELVIAGYHHGQLECPKCGFKFALH